MDYILELVLRELVLPLGVVESQLFQHYCFETDQIPGLTQVVEVTQSPEV